MEQIIEDIECIPGIEGVYFFNSKHGSIAKQACNTFSETDLSTVGKTLVKIYSEGSEAFNDIDKISLYFKESNLIIYKITIENYLIVIHDKNLNRNLMNMTIAQALKDIKQRTIKPKNPAEESKTEAKPEHVSSNKKEIETILNSEPLNQILDAMKMGLNKVMGPMASIIFQDILAEWINKNDPGIDSIGNLSKLIYNEIDDPEKINTFKVFIDPYTKKL